MRCDVEGTTEYVEKSCTRAGYPLQIVRPGFRGFAGLDKREPLHGLRLHLLAQPDLVHDDAVGVELRAVGVLDAREPGRAVDAEELRAAAEREEQRRTVPRGDLGNPRLFFAKCLPSWLPSSSKWTALHDKPFGLWAKGQSLRKPAA